MKNNLVKHILTAAVSLSFGATAATVDSPWCTINSPDQVAADDVIEVEISLKNDAPAGYLWYIPRYILARFWIVFTYIKFSSSS